MNPDIGPDSLDSSEKQLQSKDGKTLYNWSQSTDSVSIKLTLPQGTGKLAYSLYSINLSLYSINFSLYSIDFSLYSINFSCIKLNLLNFFGHDIHSRQGYKSRI